MGKPTGFIEIGRISPERRPVAERLHDWHEFEGKLSQQKLKEQAARCMDCGVPFCHSACPVGNIIPDWNDLVYRGEIQRAYERLELTNNFPEFTGRVCPAPCEEGCVVNLYSRPVTIKQVEKQIIDEAFDKGYVQPRRAQHSTGKRVAIVGSGPAGLACAQQLVRMGHAVTVFEKSDRIGGLLRYGIPDFKLEKKIIDRRLSQLAAEGVHFKTCIEIGRDISLKQLRSEFDAVNLCIGAMRARDLDVPGRALNGIHLAMDYLSQQNKLCAGDEVTGLINAKNKRVVILGGGDTGSDCLGTALRQEARAVSQFELMPRPPDERASDNPWPQWPLIFRCSASQEEGGERDFNVVTTEFMDDGAGNVKGLRTERAAWEKNAAGQWTMQAVPNSQRMIEADLVLLALGFTGVDFVALEQCSNLQLNRRGSFATNHHAMTGEDGVFACGDATRGASLVVWAIQEGRQAALGINAFLSR